MKKLLLLVAAVVITLSANAQWSLGARLGSGLQVVGEYSLNGDNYVEGRFGMYYANAGGTLMADFSALYVWNLGNMDWTPSAGDWFFDAGCGLNIGGRANYAYLGAQGVAKLGIAFSGAPIRLSLDWSPSFGPQIGYGGGHSSASFNEYGLCNLGLSCVYTF